MFADLLSAGYEPHDVERLYVHGTDKSNTWVDITETMDLKIKALQQHASQIDPDEVGKWMREWAEEEAKDKDMKYAESYRVMILKRDREEE
jgi:LmbE family N-acetylglucosaminyl deacetylase